MVVFALLSAPIAIGLAYLPQIVKNAILNKNNAFDNKNPRAETSVSPKVDKIVARCKGAHNNQLETLGPYTAGVAAAIAVGVPGAKIDKIAKLYVGSRVAYNVAYISPQVLEGAPRSLSWLSAIGSVVWLWLAAVAKAEEKEKDNEKE